MAVLCLTFYLDLFFFLTWLSWYHHPYNDVMKYAIFSLLWEQFEFERHWQYEKSKINEVIPFDKCWDQDRCKWHWGDFKSYDCRQFLPVVWDYSINTGCPQKTHFQNCDPPEAAAVGLLPCSRKKAVVPRLLLLVDHSSESAFFLGHPVEQSRLFS